MSVIDLRQLGSISGDQEEYLCHLIAKICRTDKIKHRITLYAKQEFDWDNGCLIPYVLAGLTTLSSCRIDNFISSGEWLCGILTSGTELTLEHRRIIMSFINSFTTAEMVNEFKYVTGKSLWSDAESPLKEILDLLDDSIVNQEPIVYIIAPNVIPIDPSQNLEELEHLSFEDLQRQVRIEW